MTYEDARAIVPSDAVWTSSFGYPGEGGYSENYRGPDGVRYEVHNGKWDSFEQRIWGVRVWEPVTTHKLALRASYGEMATA